MKAILTLPLILLGLLTGSGLCETTSAERENGKRGYMCWIVLMLILVSAIKFDLALMARPAVAAEVRLQSQQEWDKVLEGAKKEGRVVVAGTSWAQRLWAEFQKKYPEIKLITIPGRAVLSARIMSERRAGKYIEDVVILGPTPLYNVLYKGKALDPITPALILPEVRDESRWWKGKHRYLDAEGKYIFVFNLVPLVSFGYNTKLVDPSEIKSYWDLLHPKWKGKIVLLDPTSLPAGTHLLFLYYHRELGREFIRRLLTEMDVTVSRDTRQITDWLAIGKFAISGLTTPRRTGLVDAKRQGLPVDWFPPGQFNEGVGLYSSSGNVVLMNRAPHPNAARVAINWLLSREGQMIYQKVRETVDSSRIDIPKDNLPSYARRVEGLKYHLANERIDAAPIFKFVREVWKRKK